MSGCLIFDFDGVIIDTETTEFLAWQAIFREHGHDLSLSVWADCVGRPRGHFDPCAYLESLQGRPLDTAQIRAGHRRTMQDRNSRLPLMPGVAALMEAAHVRGLPIGIASSSDHAWVEGHLARLGILPKFDTIVCAEDTDAHKPDPAPYTAAVSRLGCSPAASIAIEDSPNGIAAARAAGLYCVAVPNPVTSTLGLDGADVQVLSLAALDPAALLDRICMRR